MLHRSIAGLVAVVATLACAATASAATPGQVARWPLDGNGNDISGNNNQAAVVNARPTTNRFGHADEAFSFHSSSYLSIPDSPSLEMGTSDYTIAAWIKTRNDVNNGRIYSKGSWNCTTGYMMRLAGDVVHLEDSDGGICTTSLDGTIPVTDGQWHHVVGVVSRQYGAQIWVDCALDVSTANRTTGVDVSNGHGATIGVSDGFTSGAPSEFFDGALDDVRIFDTALTPAQIRAMYDLHGGCGS